MSRYNVIYVDTIVCLSDGLQGLSRCTVGHRLVLTSLSRSNHFHRLRERTTVNIPAFAPSCFHHGDYISAQKNISLPSVLLCHLSGDFLYVYNKYSFAIGRISSPTIAENNKMFSTIAVN